MLPLHARTPRRGGNSYKFLIHKSPLTGSTRISHFGVTLVCSASSGTRRLFKNLFGETLSPPLTNPPTPNLYHQEGHNYEASFHLAYNEQVYTRLRPAHHLNGKKYAETLRLRSMYFRLPLHISTASPLMLLNSFLQITVFHIFSPESIVSPALQTLRTIFLLTPWFYVSFRVDQSIRSAINDHKERPFKSSLFHSI